MLSLPLFPEMNDDEQDQVLDRILEFFAAVPVNGAARSAVTQTT